MAGFEENRTECPDDLRINDNQQSGIFDSREFLAETSLLPRSQSTGEQHLPALEINEAQNLQNDRSENKQLNPGVQSPTENISNIDLPQEKDGAQPEIQNSGFVPAPSAAEILQGKNNVILIGDLHGAGVEDPEGMAAKDMVSNIMEQIRSANDGDGPKPALILEPMPENLQEKINSLDPDNPDPVIENQIRQCLKDSIGPSPSDPVIDSYLNMIMEARRAGVEIICPEPGLPQNPEQFNKQFYDLAKNPDLKLSLQDYLNNSNSEQVQAAKDAISKALKANFNSDEQVGQFFDGLEPMRHPPIQLPASMDPPDEFNQATMREWRNARYVDAINQQLSEGQNVIVFAGFKHFGRHPQGEGETIEEMLEGRNEINISNFGFQ